MKIFSVLDVLVQVQCLHDPIVSINDTSVDNFFFLEKVGSTGLEAIRYAAKLA
ncbi:MAG: hypothetical protein SFU98_13130 [Leptospiraceae bacterium]|nr:hypothetical protein [Leptospiraceae bacterium]